MTNQLVANLRLSDVLAEYKQKINEALEQFFVNVPEQLGLDLSDQSLDALEKLQEYSLRSGKRLRGALAGYAYDYASKSHLATAGVQAGVALELMQSYLLIIDDVMDKSELRRGLPTVHRLYTQGISAGNEARHLADMMAINVGLIAQHLVNIIMANVAEDPTHVLKAMGVIHRNITATGFGQMGDLYQQIGRRISEADIIQKYRLKSSYYTFINPLQTGLALAGVADESVQKEVETFGIAAGIAFQLHDDILGVFGRSQATGKDNVDDIKEGKYTLLVWHALNHANPAAADTLKKMLGNPLVSEDDLAVAKRIFISCGSKKYVEQMADRYARIAKDSLEASTFWDETAKKILRDTVDYSVGREK